MKINWANFVTDFHQAYNALNSDQALQMPTAKDIESDPWVKAQVEDLASYLKRVFSSQINFLARDDGWLQNYYVCRPLAGCPLDMYCEGLIQTNFESLFVNLMERIIDLYPVRSPADFQLAPAEGYTLFSQNRSSFIELDPHFLLLDGKPCLFICQLQQATFEPRRLSGWFDFCDEEIALDAELGQISEALGRGFDEIEMPLCDGRGFTVFLPQEVEKGRIFLGDAGVEPIFDGVRTFCVDAIAVKKTCFTDDVQRILTSACFTLQSIYSQFPRERVKEAFTNIVSSRLGDLSSDDFGRYARPGILYGRDEYELFDFEMETLKNCFSRLSEEVSLLPSEESGSFIWFGDGFSLETSEFDFHFSTPESADEVSLSALEFIEDIRHRFGLKTWEITENFKELSSSKKDIPFLAQQVNLLLRTNYADVTIGDCVSDARHFAYLKNTGNEVHFFLRPAPYIDEDDAFCSGQGAVYMRPGKGVSPVKHNETRFLVRQFRCKQTGGWNKEKVHVQVYRDVDGPTQREVRGVSTYILEKVRKHFHIELGENKATPSP